MKNREIVCTDMSLKKIYERQVIHEKVLSMICHHGNENCNHKEISLYIQ